MNRLADAGLPRRLLASSEDAIGCDGTIRLSAREQPLGGTLPAPVRREQFAQRLGPASPVCPCGLYHREPRSHVVLDRGRSPSASSLPIRGVLRRTSWRASPGV